MRIPYLDGTMNSSRQQLAKQLGARIASLRAKRSLTQERCAWEAGLSKAYLSQIEAGKRLPSLPTLSALARRLGVEMSELFVFAKAR
jgi:transcriptional regulator with XRE-family HTH domain